MVDAVAYIALIGVDASDAVLDMRELDRGSHVAA